MLAHIYTCAGQILILFIFLSHFPPYLSKQRKTEEKASLQNDPFIPTIIPGFTHMTHAQFLHGHTGIPTKVITLMHKK